MKHCPICNKQYSNEQNFCADDGAALSGDAPVQSHAAPQQPVQVIQMIQPKNKTGLYVTFGIFLSVALVIGYLFWQQQKSDNQVLKESAVEKEMSAAESERYFQSIEAAKLNDGVIKTALDSATNGSLAVYRECGEVKMKLYQQRYNLWVGRDSLFVGNTDSIPTKSQSQQNVNVAAQAVVNSCRKETEALDAGIPSFDCNKVVLPAEIAVCTSKELAQLDVKLNNAAQSAKFFAQDKEQFSAFMKTWLKNRNNCNDNADCLIGSYKSTIDTLNSQVEP